MKSTTAIESYEEIQKNFKLHSIREDALRNRKCFIHLQIPSDDCWCRKAGPGGSDLPCPTKQ